MMKLEIRPISSLEKVFYDGPLTAPEMPSATALKGEVFSFQFAVKNRTLWEGAEGAALPVKATVTLESKLPVLLREVHAVPVDVPARENDGFLLRDQPGLYPDLLTECPGDFMFTPHGWRAFWVTVRIRNLRYACRSGLPSVKVTMLATASVPRMSSASYPSISSTEKPSAAAVSLARGSCAARSSGMGFRVAL